MKELLVPLFVLLIVFSGAPTLALVIAGFALVLVIAGVAVALVIASKWP